MLRKPEQFSPVIATKRNYSIIDHKDVSKAMRRVRSEAGIRRVSLFSFAHIAPIIAEAPQTPLAPRREEVEDVLPKLNCGTVQLELEVEEKVAVQPMSQIKQMIGQSTATISKRAKRAAPARIRRHISCPELILAGHEDTFVFPKLKKGLGGRHLALVSQSNLVDAARNTAPKLSMRLVDAPEPPNIHEDDLMRMKVDDATMPPPEANLTPFSLRHRRQESMVWKGYEKILRYRSNSMRHLRPAASPSPRPRASSKSYVFGANEIARIRDLSPIPEMPELEDEHNRGHSPFRAEASKPHLFSSARMPMLAPSHLE